MRTIPRQLTSTVQNLLSRGKSVLLLGPRQTGKTTLTQELKVDAIFSFVDPRQRLRYEKSPSQFANDIEAIAVKKPLIVIDEVQKVPSLMDTLQSLIDRKVATFLLTGSSARKLRHGEMVNLLPGRIIIVRFDGLSLTELPKEAYQLHDRLIDGSLPEVVLEPDLEMRERYLDSYVTTYLEEEVRAEALVRSLGSFARFLELAAAEAGEPVNLSKLSQEIGVAHTTIAAYYEILEDCLIVERIEPFTRSKTRRKLTKAQKYLFFDLGVRRVAALEGRKPPKVYHGKLFEQFVGLELLKQIRLTTKRQRLSYFRDPEGIEVDWIIEHSDELIPIEVKLTDQPTLHDTKFLTTFLEEYKDAPKGYVICQIPKRTPLTKNIDALPFWEIPKLFS